MILTPRKPWRLPTVTVLFEASAAQVGGGSYANGVGLQLLY